LSDDQKVAYDCKSSCNRNKFLKRTSCLCGCSENWSAAEDAGSQHDKLKQHGISLCERHESHFSAIENHHEFEAFQSLLQIGQIVAICLQKMDMVNYSFLPHLGQLSKNMATENCQKKG
jgi:hypothetical protein